MLVEICGVHKNPIKIVLSMAIYMRDCLKKVRDVTRVSKTQNLEKNLKRDASMHVISFAGNLDHRDVGTRNAIGKDDKS
jgi:hypothetical protein